MQKLYIDGYESSEFENVLCETMFFSCLNFPVFNYWAYFPVVPWELYFDRTFSGMCIHAENYQLQYEIMEKMPQFCAAIFPKAFSSQPENYNKLLVTRANWMKHSFWNPIWFFSLLAICFIFLFYMTFCTRMKCYICGRTVWVD